MAATEKNELLKEIAYLSSLIDSHKQQSHVQSTAAVTCYSPKKWTSCASSWVSQHHRRVVKPVCINPPNTSVQLPLRQLIVGTKSRAARTVVPSRLHGSTAINNRSISELSKVNSVHAVTSVSGNSPVAARSSSRCVLVKSQVNSQTVGHNAISKVSRSILPSVTQTQPCTATAVPVPKLRVTVTGHASSGVRAVTTVAPSTSRSSGSNRTVLMGLQSKTAPVTLPSSNSLVGSNRIVCSPPPKPIARVVLKPAAYKWAAKSPAVKATTVEKHSFPTLITAHKFSKLNVPQVSSSPYKRTSSSVSATLPKIARVTPSTPLMTSTPMARAPHLVGTPVGGRLLKKTVKKTKYSLVRSPSLRTERKLVRNLYTWFNARPSATLTPRLKHKVGKYSLRYVKSNRMLKKSPLLPSSSYRYNCRDRVSKNRSVRHSRNRFESISPSVSRMRSRLTQKYKFFKRETTANSPKASLKKNLSTKLVMIGGILYKSSKNKLARTVRSSPVVKVSRLDAKKVKIVTVRGVKFRMDSSGKTLQRLHQSSESVNRFTLNRSGTTARLNASLSRVDLGGVTFVETRPGVLVRSLAAQKRTFASQVVNRSIHRLVAANKKSSQFCMFFNRFGKCHKKESGNCPYKHDPDKIAVCTRFLQGSCTVEKCLFSHKVCRTKMPACSFFLEGRCSSDDCPYLHVNVNPKAEVCMDFLKGYCSLGEKCKKRHTYVCPDFQRTGNCEKGKKCFLQHAAKPKPKKPTHIVVPDAASSCDTEKSVPKKRRMEEDEDDRNLPFKERRLPSFIKLDDSEDEAESVDISQTNGPGAAGSLGTLSRA